MKLGINGTHAILFSIQEFRHCTFIAITLFDLILYIYRPISIKFGTPVLLAMPLRNGDL